MIPIRTRWPVLAAALAVLLALGIGPAAAAVFDPKIFTLENGLQVVVIENHRAPVVTHMVWYKVGAADEAPGESGLAHFLEHLMFKGTKTIKPQEFSKIIAMNGGQDNAFTTHDYTAYFESVARDRLDLVMKMEADRMRNLRLSDSVVLPEREVVREERRSRVENDPGALLSEAMSAATYLNLPYRRPVIGWDHEIRELSTEKAIAFYRAHYAPNNAILVVAGDVTQDEIRSLAEKYFGPIPRRAVPPRVRPAEPPHHAEARVVLKDARVKQPQWMRDYLAPSYTDGDSKHTAALQVLAQILGGDSSSRLYRRLVVEEGVAAGVGVSYSPASVNLTEFSFQAAPRPDVPLEKIEAALDAEIARVLEQGVTAEELARAKKQLVTQATYARDSMAAAARLFGFVLATGGTVEQVESWPDRIAAVTVEQVNEAAGAVLRRENSTTGELIPQPAS